MVTRLAVEVIEEGYYRAKPGSHISNKAAQIIGPEIRRLAIAGDSSPEAIKEDARPKKAVLHPYVFTLPKDEAAEAYFLQNARMIANSVIVELVDDDGKTYEARAFPHVDVEVIVDGECEMRGMYVPLDKVRENVDYRDQVLEDVRKAARSFLNTWSGYATYFAEKAPHYTRMFAEIRRILDEVDQIGS